MKKLMMGVFAGVVCAGCSSDPEGAAKTMDFLGTAATVAIAASQPPPPPPPAVIVQQPVVVAQPALVAQPVAVTQPALVAQPVVAAQPAVAPQPVAVQAATAVPPPSAPPPSVAVPQPPPVAVSQPAVPPPAVSAPSVPAVPPPAVQAAAFKDVRTAAAETAEPESSASSLTFKKPATPEQIAAAKAKRTAGGRLNLVFEKGADAETVTAALVQFPGATAVRVRNVKGVSLAAFALLRNVAELELRYLKGLDLAPLAGLPALKEISLYASEVKDFSPLASCPRLDRIDFYSVQSTPAGYASLGTLRQVKKLHGGLTKMTSLAWLRQVPQAEELKIFAERIDDLTPIQALPNLVYLRCWNMRGDNLSTAVGDLSFLARNVKLRRLELPGSRYTNTAALAGLPALEDVDLSGAKEPVDVSFAAKLPALRSLSLRDCQVVNGAALPKTVRVLTNKGTKGL